MKKILFSLAVLFGCITVSNAQTNFVATLQHGSEFSHYYGQSALTSAYNAAVAGDIITLSPGTFTSPGTFNKGITLRGAGIDSSHQTHVTGDKDFYSDDSTMVTTIEGIHFTNYTTIRSAIKTEKGKGVIKFIKCGIDYMRTCCSDYNNRGSEVGPAVRIYNSVFGEIHFDVYSDPHLLFYNCYVNNPHRDSRGSGETTTTFVNCVINYSDGYADDAYYLNFYNCIFNWTWSYGGNTETYCILPNTATCYNCLSINKGQLFRDLNSYGKNYTAEKADDVFSSEEGHSLCELTEKAKETYIGTDGKQIGLYGGNYPYNTTPQYPIITKFSSDSQTSKEGILNIEVEVDGK